MSDVCNEQDDQSHIDDSKESETMRVLSFSPSSWEMARAYNEHGTGKEQVDRCYREVKELYASLTQ